MTDMATTIQDKLIKGSLDSLEAGKDAFIFAPTGAGKSRKFSLIAAESASKGDRVIVMAGLQDLVLQGARNMDRWSKTPVETSIGMDGHIDQSGQVVYTTVQSAHNLREHLDHYDVAVIDEAHHAKENNPEYAETMDALIKKNPNIRFVGVTATPPEEYKGLHPRLVKADKHVMTFQEAIEAKLIDLPETITPQMHYRDNQNARGIVDAHRKAKTSAALESGISRDLGKARAEDWSHQLVNVYERHLSDRRTLAFFDSIKDATSFTNEAREQNIDVDIVHSKRGFAANQESLQAFRDGRSRLLVSVDMISEGVDLDADGILLDKKTTSADEYKQIIGRESRSHGVDRERKALLVDTGGSTFMHGDIGSLANMQTLRGEIERKSLGPQDLLPGVPTGIRSPWVEMRSEETGRSVWGTSVDNTIVYAAPHGDRYAAFRSISDRKGARFEMMQIGEDRKGMTTAGALGEWICDAVRRNEKALARLAGNSREGASDLMRMIEQDWSKHRGTIDRTLGMIANPAIAMQQNQQRAAYGR